MGGGCSRSIPLPEPEAIAANPFHDLAMAALVPKCIDCGGPGLPHVATKHDLHDGREWLDVTIDASAPSQLEVQELFLSMCRKGCLALAKHLVANHKCRPAGRRSGGSSASISRALSAVIHIAYA